MKKSLAFCLSILFFLSLMISLAYAKNSILDNPNKGTISQSVHFKMSGNTPEIKTSFRTSAVSNPITVMWPESGYYYVTDSMQLYINTQDNATCSYNMDGSQFQEMEYTNGTEHFQTIRYLKDNMNSDPYTVDFSCTDKSGVKSDASAYFWINATDLDKYLIRNDFGQWKYLGSALDWEGNENGMLQYYGAVYTQNPENISDMDIIIVFIFDNGDSVKNFIKDNLIGLYGNNASIISIGNREVYIFDESGMKIIAWNSGNKLIFNTHSNLTSFQIEYPIDIINSYLQKYPGDLYVTCNSNWIKNDNKCQINNKLIVSYYDSNICKISTDISSDNGTYVNCDYCSSNIQGPVYTNWSSCLIIGIKTRTKYFTDINYKICCNVTKLDSDCSIKNSQYANATEIANCQTFNLTIKSPSNGIYNTLRTNFSIDSSTKLGKLDYIDRSQKSLRWSTLCTKCSGYNQIKNLLDGQHNLTIKANSTDGHVFSTNVSFFIDSKKPKIITTEPKSKEFTNGSDFFIKYSEENLKDTLILFENESASSSTCKSGINQNCSFADLGWAIDWYKYDGKKITYHFILEDIADNMAESKNVTVLIDITSPKIINFKNITSKNYVTFNISINETNFNRVSYIDYNDTKPKFNNLCSSLKYGNCLVKKYFKKGNHNVTIQVLDKAGNSAMQSIFFKIL